MNELMNELIEGMPTIDEQWTEAARWASLFWAAGYPAELHGTDQPEPFHREWIVFDGWTGPRVATIDIDGCGASWHGPDALWRKVVEPHTEMI